jgi:hypothetical protein
MEIDTTFGMKTASDNDRKNLLLFQLNTLNDYKFGKSTREIKYDIAEFVKFSADSFEGLPFDAYSLFGVFGVSIIFYHFQLLKKSRTQSLDRSSLYLFSYPFFNPLLFSFAYFLFHEYIMLQKNKSKIATQ